MADCLVQKYVIVLHVEMSAPHSFGSRNTSIPCYIKKGVLRAAILTVEVE